MIPPHVDPELPWRLRRYKHLACIGWRHGLEQLTARQSL